MTVEPQVVSDLTTVILSGAGLVLLVGLSSVMLWWSLTLLVGLALRFWHS